MKKTFAILAAPALLALGGSAWALSSAGAAMQPGMEQARTMTVTGQGEASGVPDVATLQFGVQTRGKTAGEAVSENASTMTAVRDRLRRMGVEARDMQTSNFSVNPVYDHRSEGGYSRSVITGYEASNMLMVRLRDVAEVGRTIDAATDAGANNLNSLQFGFSDMDEKQDEAQLDAVRDARATAEMIAAAAGVQLGPVMQIHVNDYGRGPQPVMAMRAESADMSTPIEAGESSISASVNVVFSLR